MDNLGEWKLRKYARAVVSGPHDGKEWESLLSSTEKPLVISLTKGLVRKWRIQFCGSASANEHCSRCYVAINKFLTEPFIPVDHDVSDKPDSSTSTRPPMLQMSTIAPVSLPASSNAAEPVDSPTVSDTGHGNVQATKRSPVKKRFKSADGGCARTRGDFEQGSENDRNLPKALDLIIMPGLESLVTATLQDPNFPDLVEAVHRIISNM
ncbi:uncharacterized protein [Macrobrachium rosenbergii]|uniref:uncharacterized protein isoform X2 n=1 Tax=Macrobrachium rosenbergii TaxID=79674 RepID=UPI0034D3EACB